MYYYRWMYVGLFVHRLLASVDNQTLSYKAANLQEGHEYFYRIYAQNAAGLSATPGEIRPPVMAKVPYGKCADRHLAR